MQAVVVLVGTTRLRVLLAGAMCVTTRVCICRVANPTQTDLQKELLLPHKLGSTCKIHRPYCCVQGTPAKLVSHPGRMQNKGASASRAWISCAAGLPAEANLLAAQATSSGVPHGCIVIEDQAQNSIENALNCLPILQSSKIQHIVLVTSDYHMPRCRLLFEAVLQGTAIDVCWAEVCAALTTFQLQFW